MCPPKYFDVIYEINPWMHVTNPVDHTEAARQWQNLYNIYINQLGWDVQLIDPVDALPDMVFTANGALVIGNNVMLPTFRAPDRQPETKLFERWFRDKGYSMFYTPKYDFEGEGDALVWNSTIFAGYPWRSDISSHNEIAKFFNTEVVSLQLTDARFYHLDTCLSVISSDTVALWPKAFTPGSVELIKKHVPRVIEASDDDTYSYGLNAMSDGTSVVLAESATGLIKQYKDLGFNVYPTPISEFQKSGGGVKCLTLELRM